MAVRRRILFFAEAVTLAHLVRPFVLASALDPVRYDACLACDDRFLDLLPGRAFKLRRIRSISTALFTRALAQGRPVYDLKTLRGYAREDLEVIDEIRPELIVGDFRLSLAVSAAIAKIPYLAIANAYWSPYARQRIPVPELPVTRWLGVRLAQLIFDTIRPLAFASHCRALNRLRREHALPALGHDLRRIYTHGDFTLYADIPGLIPVQGLPDTHHVLGPILWSPNVPLPRWWHELPHYKPIIYVTLGSSGASALVSHILEAMRGLDVSVMVATAGRTKVVNPPSNAYLVEYLPGEAAAARAQLVICNGGSPTTQQALYAGRPVLGLPSNLDQFLNMQAVAAAGAGILLRPQRANVAKLRQAIKQLLARSEFRGAAKALQARARQQDARARFIEVIEGMS